MSLPDEKYRSIFKTLEVVLAMAYSKSFKIPKHWREEIYYATKHFPLSCDQISIDGIKFTGYERAITCREYALMVDRYVKIATRKKSSKRKKV
jgi:hypothetical protein